jgi:hypothetical protein
MREIEKLQSLTRIFAGEARCFVRYLVEEAQPEVQDDLDGRVRGLLEAWARDSRAGQERLQRLLRQDGVLPSAGTWPLGFTQYHYLRASYLLAPLESRMRAHVESVEAEARQLPRWPEAEEAVKELLGVHRQHLERAAGLKPKPAAATKPAARGPRLTSANWW